MNDTDDDTAFRAVFEEFDRDGDGYISAGELALALRKMGDNPTDAEVAEMIRGADVDGDGRIDYREFLHGLIVRGR